MTEIDELSGVELDRAVALALGWREVAGGAWFEDSNNTPWYISADSEPVYIGKRLATFSPHSDIAQAFFVGMILSWIFEESRNHSLHRDYVYAQCCDGYCNYWSIAYYDSDEEKFAAYATARCRAWLKAMQDAE